MKDINTKHRFIELRARGKSYCAISEAIGVSKPTLIEWSRELRREVDNMRSIEIDALMRENSLYHEARLHNLGILLNRIKDEIAKRSLEDISTEKLFCLFTRLNSSIASDQIVPTFSRVKTDLFDDIFALEQSETWPA